MKHVLFAAAAAFILMACSETPSETVEETQTIDAPVAETPALETVEAAELVFTDGYIMAPLKGRDVAAGYFLATNEGDAAGRIVSAQSDVAEAVELHTHTMDDGVMKMREVEAIEVPAGGSVEFKPGSFHLMLFGFAAQDGQADASVTLTLESGETIDLALPIRERE